MKTSKIAIGASAFTLALVGFYATKANQKFVTPLSAVVYNGSVSVASMSSFTSTFNTVQSGAKTLVQLIATNGGTPTILGTVQTSTGINKHKVFR